MALDRSDVQGLILKGYHYHLTRILLLEFGDADGGKAFLRWLADKITTGVSWPDGTKPKPKPLFNLGLTFNGLRTIGIETVLKRLDSSLNLGANNPFPSDFFAPPSESTLGDLAPDDRPETWWNGLGKDAMFRKLHASVMIFAPEYEDEDVLDRAVDQVRSMAHQHGVDDVFTAAGGKPLGGRDLPDDQVHFGYRDGISGPDVDWDNETAAPDKVDRRYFLLGYSTPEIPSSPKQDLFRNSCYMAFRWLSQDVPAFERFLTDKAPALDPNLPLDQARELLAAKLVGRWRSGAPLVLAPKSDDPALKLANNFGYNTADPQGMACPFSAHIRVSNPRDQPLSSVVVKGVPPLIRRGTPYGPQHIPGQNDDADRGLLGMFLCSSLNRQFLLINGWMNRNNFSPVFDAKLGLRHDPLFGARVDDPNPKFHIPGPNGAVEIPLLNAFVRSRGTAYFLLPGMGTLRQLVADQP